MSNAKNVWIASLGLRETYVDETNTLYRMHARDQVPVTLLVRGEERVYETRIYRIVPPGFDENEAHHLKILAKTRPDGRVWWTIKVENADGRIYSQAYGDENGWQVEEAYRRAVALCEEALGVLGPMRTPVVTTGAEYEAKMRLVGQRNEG